MNSLAFFTGFFYGVCMNNTYHRQLQEKTTRITQQFAAFLKDNPPLAVFESPAVNFRQRAEFRLWHERDANGKNTGEAFYAMFEPGKKAGPETVKRIDQLPIADKRINALMPELLTCLQAQPVLIEGLFQVEFLSTLRGDMLVTLIYHKQLDNDWEALAKPLQSQLTIHIIGRSRKQKISLSQDYVTETLNVNNSAFTYRQIEGGFTQPNAVICEKMLAWACQVANAINTPEADLVELYCGNGNFTLPLSRYFHRVLATEVAKTSVNAARHNITANGCDNIAIARLSAEEFTQALTGQRQFNRLAHDNINLEDYHPNTIVVDPPRAGIDAKTLRLMQDFKHIIYISCNPDTLYANLQILTQTHHVKRLALFDQFPYTRHVEMGVWLTAA